MKNPPSHNAAVARKARFPGTPTVTDHAVIYYLEQVASIDVEAIRARIHNDTKKALTAGAVGIVANGISYRFKYGKIVSVWIDHQHHRSLDWGSAK